MDAGLSPSAPIMQEWRFRASKTPACRYGQPLGYNNGRYPPGRGTANFDRAFYRAKPLLGKDAASNHNQGKLPPETRANSISRAL